MTQILVRTTYHLILLNLVQCVLLSGATRICFLRKRRDFMFLEALLRLFSELDLRIHEWGRGGGGNVHVNLLLRHRRRWRASKVRASRGSGAMSPWKSFPSLPFSKPLRVCEGMTKKLKFKQN